MQHSCVAGQWCTPLVGAAVCRRNGGMRACFPSAADACDAMCNVHHSWPCRKLDGTRVEGSMPESWCSAPFAGSLHTL